MEVLCIPARGNPIICLGLFALGFLLSVLFSVLGAQEDRRYLLAAVPCLCLAGYAVRSYIRERSSLQRRLGVSGTTPESALAKRLKSCLRASDRATHRALIKEFRSNFPSAVVCIGTVDIPDTTVFRDEPQNYQIRVSFAPVLLLCGGLIFVKLVTAYVLPATPVLLMISKTLLMLTCASLVLAGLYWLWASNRFLRVAPGIIQVIRGGRLWGDELVIQSYPVVAGTVVMLLVPAGSVRDINPQMYLFRADRRASIPLRGVDLARVLRAITSTVKTPAASLSQEALIG